MRGFVVETRRADTADPWMLLELGWHGGSHVLVFTAEAEAREHARVEHCTGYEERVVAAELAVTA